MSGLAVRRVLLGAWTILLAWMLFPWRDLLNHPHWMNVVWIPFAPPVRVRDIAANVLFFVPLGLLARTSRNAPIPIWVVLALSALMSVVAESMQLFTHTRVPSATDVAANVMGAAAGCWLARFVT
jgi:glycopeptide antibiotics resistance protein